MHGGRFPTYKEIQNRLSEVGIRKVVVDEAAAPFAELPRESMVVVESSQGGCGGVDVGFRPFLYPRIGINVVFTCLDWHQRVRHEQCVVAVAELGRRTVVRDDDGLAQAHGLGDSEPEALAAMKREVDVAGSGQGDQFVLRHVIVDEHGPFGDLQILDACAELRGGGGAGPCAHGLEDDLSLVACAKRLGKARTAASGFFR